MVTVLLSLKNTLVAGIKLLNYTIVKKMNSKLLFVIAIAVSTAIFSCAGSTNPSETTKVDSLNLKQQVMPVIKGVWVLKSYIKAIEETKSPVKSANQLRGIVSLVIDSEKQGDSIEVSASLNNHEAGNFTAFFIPGKHKGQLKTNIPDAEQASNYYELGYEAEGKDTSLVLYHYDQADKLLDKKEYSKVFDQPQQYNADNGLQQMVNQKIVSGKFMLVDGKKPAVTVVFGKDGTLTGLSGFNGYRIMTDFLGGPHQDFDEICLNTSTSNTQCFAFEVKQDTINLFQVNGSKPRVGKLVYKLTGL